LLVLFSDAKRSTLGAALFALDGAKKIKELVGADDIAVVPHQGRQVLSLVSRRQEKSGRTRVSLALHDTLSLKRVARTSLTVDANNGIKVAGRSMRLLYWGPGMTELVALEPGKYDGARDIRLPDLRVRYDVVKKQTIGAKRPENAILARKALQMREQHPAQRRLAHVSNDLKQLYLVRADDTLRKLKTAQRWQLYEARSLRQHESWDGQVLYFSLTVDPVNPEALARKKAAPERVDFYRLDSSGSLRLLGGTLVEKREFAWAASASHIAYLRKLRGFARGGKVLELHATTN
jgi:hypothetical protein